jgi:hypothetical protein
MTRSGTGSGGTEITITGQGGPLLDGPQVRRLNRPVSALPEAVQSPAEYAAWLDERDRTASTRHAATERQRYRRSTAGPDGVPRDVFLDSTADRATELAASGWVPA